MNECIFTYTCMQTHTYLHIYIKKQACACVHTYASVQTYTCMSILIHSHIHTLLHVYVHTYTYTHAHVHIGLQMGNRKHTLTWTWKASSRFINYKAVKNLNGSRCSACRPPRNTPAAQESSSPSRPTDPEPRGNTLIPGTVHTYVYM